MNSGAITLPVPFATAAPVLAAGAWFKNSLCGVKSGLARMSRVVGDLNTPEACVAHEEEAEKLRSWLGRPAVIAHDLHPDFHSSRQAAATAAKLGAIALPVQHHHAHIASVCAEHGHLGPVIGLALDGVGLGTDNAAWGGELLFVDGARFERLGHLAPLALPGGDRAAREPWRMAAAVLHDAGRGDEVLQRYAGEPAAATVLAMLEKDVNCPRTSSAGRLFDAACGLLGLCLKMEMDAEAAIRLEQAATHWIDAHGWPPATTDGWRIEDGVLDLRPLLVQLANEGDAQQGAARFHATLVAALAQWAEGTCHDRGIDTLAIGGGCFFNHLLAIGLRRACEARGLRVLAPINLVPGDAGLALGQAWVALHHLEN